MKHLSKIFVIAAFTLFAANVKAQDQNNPWVIGLGTNVVDFYPASSEHPLWPFFDAKNNWNFVPSISRLSVGRYVGGGFSAEIAGSLNRISTVSGVKVDDLSYYSVDGTILYSLDALFQKRGWFDPFVGIGGSYIWIDSQGFGTLDGTAGINFWVTRNLGINVQTTYKHDFSDEVFPGTKDSRKHFQSVAGIKFAFGGTDTDGDGVYDIEDECPEIPGLPEFNGCPDSDGDGIRDIDDRCPDLAGPIETQGCPDSDGDGVIDPEDNCPDVAGLPTLGGCPDSDGDGVIDSEDNCPNEAGPAENKGCPYTDKDGDGVLDKDDQCPEIAGPASNNGCPEVTKVVIDQLNSYSKTVLFKSGKDEVQEKSYGDLDAIADIMKKFPSAKFIIKGYTDSVGSASKNLQLSKDRAAAVKVYLIKKGIQPDRLESEGYGEENPIASNATAAGRKQNRRVEIELEGSVERTIIKEEN